MPTEAELKLAAAQNHAAARLYTKRALGHIDALGGNMTDLAALASPPPVEDPPVIDPPSVGDYGVDQLADLKLYHWKPVAGAQPVLRSGETIRNVHIRGDGKDGKYDAVEVGGAGDGPTWDGTLLIVDGPGHIDDWTLADSLLSHGDRWGIRNWGKPIRRGGVIHGVTIRDIWDEHGMYFNVAGYGHAATTADLVLPALTVVDVLIEDMGSQGCQFVQRDDGAHDFETADPEQDFTPGGLILLSSALFRDCGHTTGSLVPGGRPSFAISFAPSRNPVHLVNTHVDNSLHAFSRGALYFEGYAPGSTPGSPHATKGYERHVKIEGGTFRTGVLEQAMLQAKHLASLEIVGAHFEAKGGQDWIEFFGDGTLTLTDCTGKTAVKVNGQTIGSAKTGFKTQV